MFVTEASRDVQQKKLYDKSVKQFNGLLKKQEQLLRGVCVFVCVCVCVCVHASVCEKYQ